MRVLFCLGSHFFPFRPAYFWRAETATGPQHNAALARREAAGLVQAMHSPTLSELYALGIGGVLVVLLSYRLASVLWDYFPRCPLFRLARISTLPYLVRRHRRIGPITTASTILWLSYIGVNMFFAIYRVQSLDDAAHGLALLASTNMIVLYLGSQLAFAADLVGVGVKRFGKIHRAVGSIVTVEAAGHVLIHISRHNVNTRDSMIFYGILVCGIWSALSTFPC